jgi:DNA-binding CsgD family transcriptional regulator
MEVVAPGIRDLAQHAWHSGLSPALAHRWADESPIALFLLGRDGELRYANAEGRRELARQSCLRLSGDRVLPADPDFLGSWRRTLRGIERLGSAAIRIASKPEPRHASIRREQVGAQHPDEDDPVVAVSLDRSLDAGCGAFTAWCAMHGLAPAEARTVLELARGDSAKAIARRTGVAVSTIRSQIRSACAKANCTSSRALVASMLRFTRG